MTLLIGTSLRTSVGLLLPSSLSLGSRIKSKRQDCHSINRCPKERRKRQRLNVGSLTWLNLRPVDIVALHWKNDVETISLEAALLHFLSLLPSVSLSNAIKRQSSNDPS